MTRIAPLVAAVLALVACSDPGRDGSASSGTASDGAPRSSVPAVGDETAAASPDGEEWLFALTAERADVTGEAVTLAGVSATTAAFTDRPGRRSRVLSTPGLLATWSDLFGDVAPNAAISGTADGVLVDATVEIAGVSPGAAEGEVVLAVRPLDGAALPASLAGVTVVVDDVALGQCTPQIPWYAYVDQVAVLLQAEMGATDLRLSAPSASEPVALSLAAPLLRGASESIPLSVSADTSAGPVVLPAAQTPSLTSDGTGGEIQVSIPAPAGWTTVGSEVGEVGVQVTLPVPAVPGARQVCQASATLTGG